jgi:hypothetical protein
VFEESVINGCFDAGNLMGPVYEDEIVTRRLYDGVVDIGFKFIIKRPIVLNGFPKTLLMFIGCIDVSIIILNDFQLALEVISADLLKRTPVRRFGESNEIVTAALYFASEYSSYTTGAVLTVDGGWMAS